MPYIFKSSVTADLLMLNQNANEILKTIGKPFATQGIIRAEEIGEAILSLHAAIADEKAKETVIKEMPSLEGETQDEENDVFQNVSLAQRAWPFLVMLKTCQQEKVDLTWGV